MMVLGPVISDEKHSRSSSVTSPIRSAARGRRARALMDQCSGPRPARDTPSAVLPPGHQAGARSDQQESNAPGGKKCSPAGGYRNRVSRTGRSAAREEPVPPLGGKGARVPDRAAHSVQGADERDPQRVEGGEGGGGADHLADGVIGAQQRPDLLL